jgi:hypothetical protein
MNEKTVVIAFALFALFVAFALVTEALCALGDNYMLQSRPMVWIVKLVRWVKRCWYQFAYEFCEKEAAHYLRKMNFGPSMLKAAHRRLFYVWVRRRMACHAKLVELSQ